MMKMMESSEAMMMGRQAGMPVDWPRWAEKAGAALIRYGLAVVLLWIGAMKFTAYEAEGIRPFVENSPLFSWAYGVFGIQGFSNLLGVVEIVLGLLIALRAVSPLATAIGGGLATGMFLSTLSFLITTGGAWLPGGFLALSVPGQFLLKDLVLLGAALWTTGEALMAARCCQASSRMQP
jgi:uncharacterized membrane protein YkgB